MNNYTNPYDELVPKPETKPGETNMGKSLLRSKTFWINGITALVGVAAYFQGSEILAANPEFVALIGTGIGILNVILRLITKEPITKLS